MPTLPPLTPLPGARLLAAVRAVDDDDDGDDAEDLDLELESIMGQGEQEQLLVLLRGRGTTPAPRAQQPQIRWDRIVTAGLGVMALTSLLFVATDSSSLLYFTPTPTDASIRVRTGAPGGPQGASARPSSFYTSLSYKEEKAPTPERRPGRRRPLPPCNYTLLSADPAGVAWDTDTVAGRLSPGHAACRVRTFEGAEGHAEAVQCLEGRHLLFLGDSLSRYQYLSLVHFLETGSWDEKAFTTTGDDGAQKQQQNQVESQRSITYREGWGEDWNDFYRLTARSLGGHEVCDCARDGHAPWAENRYYHLPSPPSSSSARHEATAGGVRVSFVGWFGGVGPRGHALPPGGLPALTQEALGCQPGACRGPHNWKDSPAGFLNGSFLREQLRPDVLLLNTGLWKALDPGPQLDALVAAAKELHASSGTDVYWKTTTSRAVGAVWVNDTVPRDAFVHAGLKAFDASIFTLPLRNRSELYRDGTTHYVPEVYTGLNHLLLNELCPPPSAPSSRRRGRRAL